MTHRILLSIFSLIYLTSWVLSPQDASQASNKNKTYIDNTSGSNDEVALLNTAKEYLSSNSIDSVKMYTKKVLDISQNKKNIIQANILLVNANVLEGNYEIAKNTLIPFLPYLEEKKDPELFEAYNVLITSCIYLKQLNDGLSYLKAAENIATEKDKPKLYNAYSIFYREAFHFELTLEYLNRAIETATINDDAHELAKAYSHYALVSSFEMKDYSTAIKYHHKAIEIFLKYPNKNYNLAVTYNNLAETHLALEEYDKARKYFEKALTICKTYNYYFVETVLVSNICKLDIINSQNLDESIRKLLSINDPKSKQENKRLICENYYYLAIAYNKTNRISEALKQIQKGLIISKKNNFWDFNEKLTSFLSEIQFKQNKYEEAYLNSQKVLEYRSESFNQNHTKKIESLRILFEITQKENDIKIKQQQLTIANQKLKKNKYLYSLLGVFMLFIVISLFRQNQLMKVRRKAMTAEKEMLRLKQDQLNQILTLKNKQATDLAINIKEKNKLLKGLKNQIHEIKLSLRDNNIKRQLQEIIIRINGYIKTNQDRIQIMTESDDLNKEFSDRLQTMYINLTDREIKILGYLRLNMSSQQISDILGYTEFTINNIRSGIRKKLHLKKGESLSSFIDDL